METVIINTKLDENICSSVPPIEITDNKDKTMLFKYLITHGIPADVLKTFFGINEPPLSICSLGKEQMILLVECILAYLLITITKPVKLELIRACDHYGDSQNSTRIALLNTLQNYANIDFAIDIVSGECEGKKSYGKHDYDFSKNIFYVTETENYYCINCPYNAFEFYSDTRRLATVDELEQEKTDQRRQHRERHGFKFKPRTVYYTEDLLKSLIRDFVKDNHWLNVISFEIYYVFEHPFFRIFDNMELEEQEYFLEFL